MVKCRKMLVYLLFVFSSINLIRAQTIKNDPSLEIIRHKGAEEGLNFKTDVTEDSFLRKERKSNEIPESEHLKEAHSHIAISEHTAQYNYYDYDKGENRPEKLLPLQHERINFGINEVYNEVSNYENGEELLTNNMEFFLSDLQTKLNEEQENIMNKELLNENNEVSAKSEKNEDSVEGHTVKEVHAIIRSRSKEVNNEKKLDVYQEEIPEIFPEEEQDLEKFGSSEEKINTYIYRLPPNVKETYWYDKERAKQIPWNERDEKETDEHQGFEKQSWTWNGAEAIYNLNAQEEEENGEKEKDMIQEVIDPPGYFSDIQTSPVKASSFPKTQPKEDDICSLPAQTGTCKAYLLRYFYNSKAKECEHFVYGGCHGNANNFKTIAECTKACVKIVHS